MPDLNSLRNEIDGIDREIQTLFEKRMEISKEIATYKASCGMPVFDAGREEKLLGRLRERAKDEEAAEDTAALYETLLAVSRRRQEDVIRSLRESEK